MRRAQAESQDGRLFDKAPKYAARKAAGVTVELHVHDLRHTGDTLTSTAGAGTRELMTGWGTAARVPRCYQHMTSDRDRAVADRLGAMIRGGGGSVSDSSTEDAERAEWHACGTASGTAKGQPGRKSLLSWPSSLCPRQDSNLRHPL